MKVAQQVGPATGLQGLKTNGPKESVGDVANRVSNSGKPSGRRVQGQGSAQLDKDAFFKLMLAQVKNQDPTNPVKNHEMAAQLAQFSSLEQMSNVNETLKQMQKGQGQDSQFQALDLMGKVVKGDSGKISRSQGDNSHELSFNLKGPASEVNVSISNAAGKVLKTIGLQNLPKGIGHIQWDGKDHEGVVQPQGSYRVFVDAKDALGQKVASETEFGGKVTGVQFSEAGPIVSIGNQNIPLKDIKFIEAEKENKSSEAQMAAASLQRMMPQGNMFEAGGSSPIPQGLPMEAAQLANLSLHNSFKK
jgi:flagellar basal-body rod modification protein FlgD